MPPPAGPTQARRALSGLLHEGKQALKAKEVSAALLAAEQARGLAFTSKGGGCVSSFWCTQLTATWTAFGSA